MPRRIVACGGQQLQHPALTRYVFDLTGRPRPKILFVPTASGDDPANLLTFYQTLASVSCEATHLALFHRTVDDIEGLIRAQDVVMVSGGKTANMMMSNEAIPQVCVGTGVSYSRIISWRDL